MRDLRRLLVVTLALVCTLGTPAAHAQTATATPTKTDDVVELINRARVKAGVLPLARSPELDSAAQAHSADMVQHNYLDHTGSDGTEPQDRADAAGYHVPPNSAWIVVEVISAQSGDPQGPVNWWLSDNQHARVLLNPRWRELGAGYAQGGDYGNYWTVDVGCRPGVLPSLTFDDVAYTHTEQCGDPNSVVAQPTSTPQVTATPEVTSTPAATPTLAPSPTTTSVPTPPTPRAGANNGYPHVAAGGRVAQAASLTTDFSAADRGGVVNVQWRGIQPPTSTDWIGLYRPGDADVAPISWVYVGCATRPLDARPLGACNVAVPTGVSPGMYEFRLFSENGYERIAASSPIHVS